MMTKRDTIEAIRGFNATASPDFLSEFPSEELARYLDRLTLLRRREQAERPPAHPTFDGRGAADSPIACP